jgi:hypothetical protein
MDTLRIQTMLLAIIGGVILALLPAITSAATLRTPPNNLGLVGYWSFEDGSGSTATDFSGSGNDGTLTNMDPATDWVSGKRGSALTFDGSNNEYVEITNSFSNWYNDNPVSAFAWVKTNNEGVVLSVYSSGHVPAIIVKDDGTVGVSLFWHGNTSWVESSTKVDDGGWHLIGGVYDGTDEHVYVDGNLEGTRQPGSQDDFNNGDYSYGIGADPRSVWNSQTQYFTGKIDDLRVFDRALSTSEVKDLYQSGYSKVNSSRELEGIDGLVGWWTIDGKDMKFSGSSGTSTDASGNGNDGKLFGNLGRSAASKGRIGQALNFDGSGDYIATEHFYDTNNLTEVTISSWYKSSSVADQIIIASDRNEYWRLGVGSDGANGVQWTVDSSDKVSTKSKSYFEDGEWHHIAAVFDASLTNDHKLYIDGELDNEWSVYSSGIGSNRVSHTLIGVGSEAGSVDGGTGPNDWMDGSLDDVRLYDRALSADEIDRIYNATRPSGVNTSQTDKLTDGLVGFWSFDGSDVDLSDSSAEVKDASGNGNHGDAKNGAKPAIGRLGQGFKFEDFSDEAEVGDKSIFDFGNGEFSVFAWVNQSSQSTGCGQPSIVSKGYGGDAGQWTLSVKGQRLKFYADENSHTAPPELSTNKWEFVGVIRNGNDLEFYSSGEALDESNGFFTGLNITSGKDLQIGENDDNCDMPFDGTIDNVRIYDRALSASEVDKLYQLGN